jgi:hypothetical protein
VVGEDTVGAEQCYSPPPQQRQKRTGENACIVVAPIDSRPEAPSREVRLPSFLVVGTKRRKEDAAASAAVGTKEVVVGVGVVVVVELLLLLAVAVDVAVVVAVVVVVWPLVGRRKTTLSRNNTGAAAAVAVLPSSQHRPNIP